MNMLMQYMAASTRRRLHSGRAIAAIAITSASLLTDPALAGDASAERDVTAQWIVERAREWAEEACGGKWTLSEILADDFHGTSPRGTRYDKPQSQPVFDSNTPWSTDCRLDAAEVRFFGPDVAVVFGAESRTLPPANERRERRCLVWTDTWLHRNGRWQIIAAQDNRVECPTK